VLNLSGTDQLRAGPQTDILGQPSVVAWGRGFANPDQSQLRLESRRPRAGYSVAMSEENVEKVRRTIAAYNRGDIEEALEEWAPDAVWDWSKGHGFDAGIYRGRDEIRAFWHERLAAFEEIRIEVVGFQEIEDELLIVENIGYVRGRDGIEAEARSAWVIGFRDGEQTRLTLYQTKQEALEAAGLSG
jgi:ketosteroid isomerase-like protein